MLVQTHQTRLGLFPSSPATVSLFQSEVECGAIDTKNDFILKK